MKKIKLFLSTIALCSLVVTGCKQSPTTESPSTSEVSSTENQTTTVTEEVATTITQPNAIFTPESYPIVDGSTATIPLSEQFAASAMGMDINSARTYIQHNTTHDAYVNLINKTADIIFVTSPSEEEYQLAKEAGVELEIYPVVSEGFVFLVNQKNPISNLTSQQVVDIYSDKTKNWKEVGGEDREIIPYQRETNSGSQTGMLSLVMKDTPIAEPPRKRVIDGMDGLVESIATYDNSDIALGYSYYYYINSMMMRDEIKLLSIDGIAPIPENIQSKQYPYTTAYYVIIRKDEPANSPARTLLEWTLSETGQKASVEAGYIPIMEGIPLK